MRKNATTGEPVLEMDYVGHREAKREILGQWDPGLMAKKQDRFANEMWVAAGSPKSWEQTINRMRVYQ